MDLYLVGICIYLASIFISRIINEKSMKLLTSEEKSGLVDNFKQLRLASLVFTFTLIFICLAFFLFFKDYVEIGYSIFLLLIVMSMILFMYLNYRALIKFNYPIKFIKLFIAARSITLAGILILFYCVVQTFVLPANIAP